MDKRLFASYDNVRVQTPLSELCQTLFDRQIATWPGMNEAYGRLKGARQRDIKGDGFIFTLQFNPGRVKSVMAETDAASIAKRPCFLCSDQRPSEQAAIMYHNDFEILCNPYPIFTPHLTIVHCRHLLQDMGENARDFLALARDLSPRFSVFYNGPRCGASAPDHLHFQASPSGAIPVEHDDANTAEAIETPIAGVSFFISFRPGRRYLLLEGDQLEALASAITAVMMILKVIEGGEAEAMVNIIAAFADGRWRVWIFPRRKHRPDVFFRQGDDARAVTPGAVEMGGLVVSTRERDFMELDWKQLIDIFEDVSADEKTVRGLIDALVAMRK
ncbi:MAG: hypothetical protein CSYNP_01751 [Syntrophus sp. SKADARSKE-3]|nr:hypothetical protein [Syntrophus sp. SKADARSKE-3]